ncbi:MAG: VWA domain-containing protein [Armatimonadetes bacterium]|nr:VWA domain-containing protein [Armatimonadota bacterium]
MTFARPELLLCLLPLILLGLLLLARERGRARLLGRFMQEPMLVRLAQGYSASRAYLVLTLELLGLAVLVVALAGPQWGAEMVKVESKGLDVIFAVDCSHSMLARDFAPNRMEAAKRELGLLMERLRGNRMGLVGFAGQAHVFCPLTLDLGATRLFLEQLDDNAVPIPGTAIGDGIRACLDLFGKDADGASRVIILLTDGEDHHSEPLKAAEEAAQRGVTIFTIGLGTAEGARLPDPQAAQDFLRDDEGQVVVSRLGEKTLQEIARLTGGTYQRAEGPDPLAPVVDAIQRMERRKLEERLHLQYEERFQIFLGVGLGLLALARIVAARRRAGR